MEIEQAVTVSKKRRFEAGHWLKNTQGPCSSPHGHSMKLKISLTGIPDKDSNMLLDLGVLGKVLDVLTKRVDHAMLINKDEEPAIFDLWERRKWNYIKIDGDPTIEVLLPWLVEEVRSQLKTALKGEIHGEIQSISGVLQETESNSAEYQKGF